MNLCLLVLQLFLQFLHVLLLLLLLFIQLLQIRSFLSKLEGEREVINISNVTLQIVHHIRLAACGPGFGRPLFLIDLQKLLNVKHCYTVDVMTSVTQTEIKDEPQSSWSPALLPRSPVFSHQPPFSAAPPGEREQREDRHVNTTSYDPTK